VPKSVPLRAPTRERSEEALASAKATADRLVKAKRFNACLTPCGAAQALVTQAQAATRPGLYGMPVA